MPTAPHNGCYRVYNQLLRRRAEGVPRLLIDLDRLDGNIARLLALQPPERLRLVAKSLPGIGLLEHIGSRLWADPEHPRLMVFHLPFLLQLCRRYPSADILMGKPLPIAAMKLFYTRADTPEGPADANIQWLVDSAQRLRQVLDLAIDLRIRLTVNLELDVGMHRGGLADPREFSGLLEALRSNKTHLRLGGFMGYDAHAAKAPWPMSARRACERAAARYTERLNHARIHFSDLEEQPWCVNGAGSPTLSMHDDQSPLNDFSIGSALLKPASFDLPSLAEFEPAAWIATPVLKRLQGVQIPFLEPLPAAGRDTLFIYGGRWMAVPASPDSLQENSLYGLSSNQQLMTVTRDSGIDVDDFVFLRPTQSEAVLLQFGDLLAVRGDEVEAEWPTLRNEFRSGPLPEGGIAR